jgi:hypothetical protein
MSSEIVEQVLPEGKSTGDLITHYSKNRGRRELQNHNPSEPSLSVLQILTHNNLTVKREAAFFLARGRMKEYGEGLTHQPA